MRAERSCRGISFKSQILYAMVFTMRYLDLFAFAWALITLDTEYLSPLMFYNTVMKILFLAATYYILHLMNGELKSSYDGARDTFKIAYLIGPCAVLALFINEEFGFFEILWTFSIYLEAVAVMPQLLLLQRTGEADALSSHYMFAVGGYRALYLVNWIYRYFTEPHYSNWIVWIAGLVQTGLYVDFFYYYFVKIMSGDSKMRLPTTAV